MRGIPVQDWDVSRIPMRPQLLYAERRDGRKTHIAHVEGRNDGVVSVEKGPFQYLEDLKTINTISSRAQHLEVRTCLLH